jgi:hypothetical protein
MILVDDADKYLPFRFFFDSITGPLSVNPKNNEPYTVPFEASPKFVFTSNFMPDRSDASAARRLLFGVFSDYYHKKTDDNEYLETRKVYDDFGKNLFGDQYTEDEWNADLNFLMDCTQFYLSTLDVCEEIQPPLGNVRTRILLARMTNVFFDWAQVYFHNDSENCNQLISKHLAFADFTNSTRQQKWSMNKFTQAIEAFCKFNSYTLNPVALRNSGGRIARKLLGKTTEMIYMQTPGRGLNVMDVLTAETAKNEATTANEELPPF